MDRRPWREKIFRISIIVGIFLCSASLSAKAETFVSPHPENQLSATERFALDEIRQAVQRINQMSGLAPGNPGYVRPEWVTIYQSRFESPPGSQWRTRAAGQSRDTTVGMLLQRNGSTLFYRERIPNNAATSLQCVIYFAPSFWMLGAGSERTSRIAHETFHCFQQIHRRNWDLNSEEWIYEGAAQFVGDFFGVNGLAGGGSGALPMVGRQNLDRYVAEKNSLNNRGYDAAPFFSHLTDETNINETLLRLQRAYRAMSAGPVSISALFRILVEDSEVESIDETWASRLWQARAPFADAGEDWNFDYLGATPAAPLDSVKYDFAAENSNHYEFDIFNLQPEILEIRVHPNNYYRVTYENAEGRALGRGRGGGGTATHSFHEENEFTFCVGDQCECPGGGAYEFEIFSMPDDDEATHIVLAVAATEADPATGSIRFGKVRIEQLAEPPCCAGGLSPAQGFPDITGAWRLRQTRLEAWAREIFEKRVEVYKERREADCTDPVINDQSSVSINGRGLFAVDFGGTTVEFTCRYTTDRGTNDVERTWRYVWNGGVRACMTLQAADGLRQSYPQTRNPQIRDAVENYYRRPFGLPGEPPMSFADAYNDAADPDKRVSMGPYQPIATANAHWSEALVNIDYNQQIRIVDNDGPDIEIVDQCRFASASVSCETGAPRIIGDYQFINLAAAPASGPPPNDFLDDEQIAAARERAIEMLRERGVLQPGQSPDELAAQATPTPSTWFDVFGTGDAATGIAAPFPFYFPEFAGGVVEYPNLER